MNPLLAGKAVVSFVKLVRDPNRLTEVFEFADAIATPEVLGPIRAAFASTPDGERALRERPRVGRIDLAALSRLPSGTLGRAFAEHMNRNHLDPAALPTREANDEFEFIQAHLYETHDVWHAVTGFGADVAGELGLQAFYLAQFPARLAAAILSMGLLNTVLYAFDDRDARMDSIVRGWQMGRRAKSFLGVRWNTLWSRPLSEVREMLNVDVPDATVTSRRSITGGAIATA